MREGKRFVVAFSSLFLLIKLFPASQSSRRVVFYKRREANSSIRHLSSKDLSLQVLRAWSPSPPVREADGNAVSSQ